MIKKCHYDVILWGGFGSTQCDPNLMSHLRRFFAGHSLGMHQCSKNAKLGKIVESGGKATCL